MIKLSWKTPAEVGVTEPKISTLKRVLASPSLALQKEILYCEVINISEGTPGKYSYKFNTALASFTPITSDASRLIRTPGLPMPVGEDVKRTRIYVVYNPGKEIDATPAKLLELNPPTQPENIKQRWVNVTLTLNRKGEVVDAIPDSDAKPELAPLAVASVKKWRFSEPSKTDNNGQASLRIPVIFAARGETPSADGVTPVETRPALVKRPSMPSGDDLPDTALGNAFFECLIDPTGRVTSVTLLKSNNPAWAELMVDQYLGREYKPATKEGRPVDFKLSEGITSTGGSLHLPTHSATYSAENTKVAIQAGQVSEKAYDVPPSFMNMPAGAYPLGLLTQGIEGKVGFIMTIDEKGQVAQPTILEASHEELRLATRAMLDACHFQPAKQGNKPVAASFRSDFTFGLRKGDVHLSDSAREILEWLNRQPELIITASEADQAATQNVFLKPVMPTTAWRTAESGSAEIEFIIDRKGHAQLPNIITASEPAFGYAAAQAVVFWRFKPLTKNGQPATVRTRVTLKFPDDCKHPFNQLNASDRP